MSRHTAKDVLDNLFRNVNFNNELYKRIVRNNIEFICRTHDHKILFGSRLLGNFHISYTTFDKSIFYNNIFDMEVETVIESISSITTINKNFKIARDDINLVTFYIAHRFLSNESLPKDKRKEFAKEILNYFSYRTLVLIHSNYFVYPLSDEKAITLSERLSNRYIIKKLKNWNEYCQYRSEEYLNNKFFTLLLKFNNDTDLPNAINDLFNRTKDTIKNIYKEFIDMMENDEIIQKKKGVVNDIEGQEVILDKLDTPDSYYTKIETSLSEKNMFVRKDLIDVSTDIISYVSYSSLEEILTDIIDYNFKSRDNNIEVTSNIKDILINSIEYLNRNNIRLGNKSSVLHVINSILGNLLYARGTDLAIKNLKDKTSKLLKKIYKSNNKNITERNLINIRNSYFIYILLLAILS